MADRDRLGGVAGEVAPALKFFELEARFPRPGAEVPEQVVAYVAEQVKVDSAEFGTRSRSSRTSWRL
jgi:hypothetical protein